jgi:hypothetical protein
MDSEMTAHVALGLLIAFSLGVAFDSLGSAAYAKLSDLWHRNEIDYRDACGKGCRIGNR